MSRYFFPLCLFGNSFRLSSQDTITLNESLSVSNLYINVIDKVLSIPGNLSTVLNAHNLTSTLGMLNSTNTTDSQGISVSLADFLISEPHGFTLFAPSNQAVNDASSSLTSFAGNNTAIATLVDNHVRE